MFESIIAKFTMTIADSGKRSEAAACMNSRMTKRKRQKAISQMIGRGVRFGLRLAVEASGYVREGDNEILDGICARY